MRPYSILISQQQLNDRTPLNDNLDFDYVLPHIYAAQDLDLVPVIGQALFDDLMKKVKDDTLMPDDIILLDDYITQFLAYALLTRALPSLAIKLVNSGVVQRLADDSQPLSLEEIDKLVNNYERARDDYRQRLIDYLCYNSGLYPTFCESKTWENAPSRYNYDLGIDLTGVGNTSGGNGGTSGGGNKTNNRFTDLIDTPDDYVGEGLKTVQVKSGEDGLEFVLGGGGGGDSTYEVHQVGHGFAVNTFLHFDGTVWILADASLKLSADVEVVEVVDIDNFKVAFSGLYTITAVTSGKIYYLGNAGTYTDVKPANNIQILFRAGSGVHVLYISDMVVYNGNEQERTIDIPIGLEDVVAGTNVSIDKTDPLNPVISSTDTVGVAEVFSGVNILVDNTDPSKPVINSEALNDVLAGQNVTINKIDPLNPIISSTTVTSAGSIVRVWFTGDTEGTTQGTFYLSNGGGKGSVAEALQTIDVNDDEKDYFAQDVLGSVSSEDFLIPAGTYSSFLSVESDEDRAQLRFTIELYFSDGQGIPVDSPDVTQPIGDLGVRVLAILDTGLLEFKKNEETQVNLSGAIPNAVTELVGQRIRYHVSGAKIGTSGGVNQLTLYYGSDHNSYLDAPVVGVNKDEVMIEDKSHPSLTARTYETLTRAEYDAIATKDPEQLYFTPKA